MSSVDIDPWDLRHLLLSLEDRPRGRHDEQDLATVVGRAVTALSGLPRRPVLHPPDAWTAPFLVEGHPLWVFETNAWLLAPDGRGGDCIIVDVPPAPDALVSRIADLDLNVVAVIVTHGHIDHAGGAAALLDALPVAAPILAHPGDHELILHPESTGVLGRVAADVRPPPEGALVALDDGATLTVGSMTVRAVHMRGHTPGSTSVLVEGSARPMLVTGDTLFAGGTGRCDLPGGSRLVAQLSLRNALTMVDDETVVLPGHGRATTIGDERPQHGDVRPLVA